MFPISLAPSVRSLPRTRSLCSHLNRSYSTKPGRVIFSGIQPTGIVHLGNYLGAISNWVELQNNAKPEDQILFSIVGWHALTLPQNPKVLRTARRDTLAALLAFGIDPKKTVLFHQEDNQCHTELAWILSCITPLGTLRRMTTWKSRLADSRNANSEDDINEGMLNAGLFTYPVLQAADILAYRATHVPVGEDQTQHLELSRDLAKSFNKTFNGKKRFFPVPEQMITPFKRVLSLKDPTSKMSKSSPDPTSRILLTDTYPMIQQKLRGAVTDSNSHISFDPINLRGTANLLSILSACTGETIPNIVARYTGKEKAHGILKMEVADSLEEIWRQPRQDFERLRGETEFLDAVAKEGARKAKDMTQQTMKEVRTLVGLC
ncbi:tryptophanyl-tRNA synthetase [Crepidotus variabilis]|uniref:tryptophan--tRNA ligase n=1 Tax=Crepidotus variabilis TaxID=179855 RepID=A0A9P6EG00_9AGAR|nr:tryptophanyl-tRNA synthetase [Crepidotus variabilis]